MKYNLEQYIISENSTIFEALQKIDNNNNRFVIVVDLNKVVKGVLTDGDIRRSLLKGIKINDKIYFSSLFYYIDRKSDFSEVCEKFKNKKIEFLPILDKSKIVNIITKKTV